MSIDRDSALAWLGYASLVAAVIFQLTVLPETLNVKFLGRLVNAALLLVFSGLFLFGAMQVRVKIRVMLLYIMPIFVIIIGFVINLSRGIGFENVGYVSILLPYLAGISLPFLKRFDISRAWEIYYWIMIVLCGISVIEYVMVFSGWLPLSVHLNDRNNFLRGIVTIFYDLGGSTPHYRLYGVFFEPGTAAMLALPALAYSLIRRRLIGIAVFIAIFALTDSLGGYMALAVTFAAYLYICLDRLRYAGVIRFFAWTLALPIGAILLFFALAPVYEHKAGSALVREQNIIGFFSNFFGLILQRPFGFSLSGSSLTSVGDQGGYLGSNFMFYVAYVEGGVLAMIGYLVLSGSAAILAFRVILMPKGQSPAALAAFISLPAMLLFSFQRGSIFETVLLAFLYAIPMIEALGGGPARYIQRNSAKLATRDAA